MKKIFNFEILIIVLPSEEGTMMNHDAAGGVGCKLVSKEAKVFPPLTCLYMASILKKSGYKVELRDLNITNSCSSDVINLMSDSEKIYILFGSLPTIELDIEILKRAPFPYNTIYVNAVAQIYETVLTKLKIRAIVCGDVEKSIVDAVERMDGAVYNDLLSKDELDALPYPNWDIVNAEDYTSYTVLSSRGCSLGCPHCPYYRFQRSSYTPRRVDNVLEEITYLYDKYRIDYFLYRDPCFSYDMSRTEILVEGMKALPFRIRWGCETRIEYLNEKLIKKMSEAGCHHIRMGIETVSKNILQSAGRLTVLKKSDEYLLQAERIVNWCKKYGIFSVQYYMIGFPEDSYETIRNIKDFVIRVDPDVALVNYIVPYPGTQYRERLKMEGLFNPDIRLSDYGSKNTAINNTKFLTREELIVEKQKLDNFFEKRNRQFYPIR